MATELQRGMIPGGQPCPFADGRCYMVAECDRELFANVTYSCGWARALDLNPKPEGASDHQQEGAQR